MIGTTSIDERHEEILYPSITVCPKKVPQTAFNGTNFSIFQRSLNMSEVMHNLRFYQRNKTGHWNKETYRETESKDDLRDMTCHLRVVATAVFFFRKVSH